MQDPQSLHKYAYTHGDPNNGTDPSGRNLLGTTIQNAGIIGAITAVGAGAVLGVVSYNVARDANHLPDGLIVTLSGGAAVRGFQGGLGIGIYAEISTGVIYWFHTETLGTAPLSAFKANSPSGSISFDIGFSWNTDTAQNLAGYSTTAALPIFLLNRLSKFKRGVTSATDWQTFMLTLAQYSKGSNIVNRRHGALSLTQSIGNGAAVTSFSFRSYNFAWTISHSSSLKPLVDLNVLGDAAGDLVARLKEGFDELRAGGLTAQEAASLVDELDDDV